jgi:23S rRNA pseudouridine1911/1915/1917 synthase
VKEIKLFVDEELANERMDKVLGNELDEISRSQLQKLIKQGNVEVNNEVMQSKKHELDVGDEVVIHIPKPKALDIQAEDIPLTFVYEDDDVIIINKKPGMVVHPAPGHWSGTLVNALMNYTDKLSSINGVKRPGIVHRIDKDTSGLLMIAKNDIAHRSLAKQLKEHSITRKYIAIVHGNIREVKGTIRAPIGRSKSNRLKMAVVKGGKDATTHFKVLERYNKYTVLELQLETGRTHQIRVHMSYIHHEILGDPLYGRSSEKIKHEGQLLHAKTLGFILPTTGEYMEFTTELPAYFQEILEKVRHSK